MEKEPVVSVIIPTYNRPDLTGEAAASVLKQTFRDFELIIVDDGSDDAPFHRLQEEIEALRRDVPGTGRAGEAAEIPPVRLIRMHRTGMPGAVRNRGVRESRGKYLAFLDSDDLWLPGKLEGQLGLLRHAHGIRWAHTREHWIRNGKTVSQRSRRHAWSGDLFPDSLKKCIIGPSTVMMERLLFVMSGGFREDLEVAEDYELWLRLTAANPIECVNEPLTVKRAGHQGQLSEKYAFIEPFRIRGLLDLCAGGHFPACRQDAAFAELARKCAIYARGARKRGKIREAAKFQRLADRYGRC